jgi:hypothetical protein
MPFVNAAPMTQFRGINDLSTRTPVYTPEAIPTHLPKVYIFAQKGPTDPQLVAGDSRTNTYGTTSFDVRSKYANHATVLANTINTYGNYVMMQRLKPDDAAPPANVRLMLDVLPCTVDVFKRETDGSISLDATGNPIKSGQTTSGFKVKWVAEHIATDTDGTPTIGAGEIKNGTQIDETTRTQSKRYPIADLEVSSFGEYGNNLGLRLWAPTLKSSSPVDTAFLNSARAYPFRIACISRADKNSTATIVATNYAEQYLNVCLKPMAIDKVTDTEMYVGTRFISSYQDLNNANGNPPTWGPFGQAHFYDEYIAELLQLFYDAEKPHFTTGGDFTGEEDESYRFNIFSGVYSTGDEYVSFQLVPGDTDAVRLGELTNIFATGGADGTMNDEIFADLVSREVAAYSDTNSRLMDDAYYPESIIYDSGFPLKTKFDLINFIAVRKDTAVVLSTHTVGGKTLTASEESAVAVALRTRLQMYPESTYYGTPVVRGIVIGRSGLLINSQYRKRLPLAIEFASKAAAYMGAANGKWKNGYSFDHGENSQIRLFSDVNVTYTPASVRNKDWDIGLVWVEQFDRRALYFPALKTIYNNDTSILSSFFNMMICVELQKIGARARRKFSGADKLTEAQLINGVQSDISAQAQGRFDDRCVIKPEVTVTASDKRNGFSWTTIIRMYGNNMKTVQDLTIETHRLEDLETSS